MTDNTPTKTEKSAEIKISFDAWNKARDLKEWMDAARTMNMGDIYKKMAQIVKSWPFEGDPTKVESYDELALDEFARVFGEVREKVTTFFLSKIGAG